MEAKASIRMRFQVATGLEKSILGIRKFIFNENLSFILFFDYKNIKLLNF